MRYYDIRVTDSSGNLVREWTSHPNGISAPPDPGALNVVFDLLVFDHVPKPDSGSTGDAGGHGIRVWGIPLSDIGQATDLVGMTVQVFGGMGKGLPLANPSQARLLVKGQIFRAFGNWIGVNMTLDLIVTPVANQPANLSFVWAKGSPLSTAITAALHAAYPGAPVTMNISPNLVLNCDEKGYYGSLGQFNDYLNGISKDIVGGTYNGVRITIRNGGFVVFDGTTQSAEPIAISFLDLIGQPTWIDVNSIQVTCVMRADIGVGDQITLPATQVTQSALGSVSLKLSSIFTGTFLVQRVRHIGNYKDPNGSAWATVIEALGPQ